MLTSHKINFKHSGLSYRQQPTSFSETRVSVFCQNHDCLCKSFLISSNKLKKKFAKKEKKKFVLMVHLLILWPGTTILIPKRPPKNTEDKEETIQKLEVRGKCA